MEVTMYEINWHNTDKGFSHCSVTPINVIRRSVLPGCSQETITAVDSKGNKFQGDPFDYFDSEEEAWINVEDQIKSAINDFEYAIEIKQRELDALKKFKGEINEQHS